MQVVRRGYRVVFESAARAWDLPAVSARQEFIRKARTIAGNFQLFARHRWLLDPRPNRLFLQTISHKALRLMSPVLLLVCAATNLLLLDDLLYVATFAAQGAFYLAAVGGWLLSNSRRSALVLAVPFMFCLLNCVTLIALIRFLSGRQAVTWERQG
jgi:hypothetical protein